MNAMDALREVLRGQMEMAHQGMEHVVADLDDEQLHRRLPGSTVQSMAAIYVHALLNEDSMLNATLRGQPAIFESGGWQERLGFAAGDGWQTDAWAAEVRIADLGVLQEYAAEVHAATNAYLAALSEADFDRIIPTGGGDMSLARFLSIVAVHALLHGGELCALKGCMGGKGMPF